MHQLKAHFLAGFLLACAGALPANEAREASNATPSPSHVPTINGASGVPDWALAFAFGGTSSLMKRAGKIVCQPKEGHGDENLLEAGDRKWVPVKQWNHQGWQFCSDRSGQINQMPQGHGQTFSDYPIKLTSGDPGHITCNFHSVLSNSRKLCINRVLQSLRSTRAPARLRE